MELLNKAFNLAVDTEFQVCINGVEKKLSYMELGLYLFEQKDNIKLIKITEKEI